jgi:ABC-type sugar transport system ATPase subunit
MATVSFDHLTKIFENGFVAVDDFSLEIQDGELLVLVGPSGCGKSTALRMLAGLDEATDGEIRIDGLRVNEVAPQHRDIAMVFQSYALYPHMTVRENIQFGLKLHHLDEDEINERVRKATELLGLEEVLDRRPKQLSGGQRQRVAMGRALVREPKVFLLDEPLSNLDAKLRVHMRSEISLLQQRLGTTMLYVTHDQVEAMTMGDRVAVMRNGKLLQVGTPKEIYNEPINSFVAGFIGSPSMNMAQATLGGASGTDLHIGTQVLRLEKTVFDNHPSLVKALRDGCDIDVGIRPEDLEDAQLVPTEETRCLHATVQIVEELGSQTIVHFGIDAVAGNTQETKDVSSGLVQTANFVGTFSARTNVQAGQTIAIAVDVDRIHFFARESGLSL